MIRPCLSLSFQAADNLHNVNQDSEAVAIEHSFSLKTSDPESVSGFLGLATQHSIILGETSHGASTSASRHELCHRDMADHIEITVDDKWAFSTFYSNYNIYLQPIKLQCHLWCL